MNNSLKRLIKYSGKTKLASQQDIQTAFQQHYSKKNIQMLSFYNSEFDMIITDPAYMVMPIDERIINRAHGIFESMAIKKFQFFSLDMHLQRFEESAKKAGIPFPMKQEEMKEIMIDMAQNSYSQLKEQGIQESELEKININMRLWISSGRQDFGIYSVGKQPIFYCATFVNHELNNKLQSLEQNGIKEFSLPFERIQQLETCKSTAYLKNCVQADFSKSQGGYQGIGLDKQGNILEQAMANVAYIHKQTKEFIHVPVEHIVQSTTLKKVIEKYVEPVLINEKKTISKVTQQNFTAQDVIQNAQEFISFGGDKIIPIVQLDNKDINDGKRGDFCVELQQWYQTLRVTQIELPIPFEYEKKQ